MKLEMELLAGETSKAFLHGLTKQLDRMEKLVGKLGDKPLEVEDVGLVEATDEDLEEDEDFSAKPAKAPRGKKAATVSFDDDDEPEEIEASEEDDEESVATPPKKTRAKKVTVEDVNDACKARAAVIGGKAGRAEVLAILKKKFKTQSVSELKPEQYADCIEAMAVEQ